MVEIRLKVLGAAGGQRGRNSSPQKNHNQKMEMSVPRPG